MKFSLIKKTYKDERYESDLGKGLKAIVKLHYHTYLKYWDVIYVIMYPPYYQTEHIFEKGYIESRREARAIADDIMMDARLDDWKTQLSTFYQKEIMKSIGELPKFLE